MRVLVCPDKFKGSLTAPEAAEALRRGIVRAMPGAEVIVHPLADGGEGSMDLLRGQAELQVRRLRVRGPLRRWITVEYLLGGGRAVIESARACGLQLVPPQRRHPKNTTTIGVGMLIEDALARGAREVTLFLGGSATNDGGAGMAAALGYRFIGAQGEDFIPMADSLQWVDRIDGAGRLPALAQATITAACDVTNSLTGPEGATYSYAVQKGAAAEELADLELGMLHFAGCIRRDLGQEVYEVPGAGAAGGLGAGAVAFLGARLRSGTEVLFEALGVRELAEEADLIVTGEGAVDEQTLRGKLVGGVLGFGRPTVVVCGRSALSAAALGAEEVIPLIVEGMDETRAVREAAKRVEAAIYAYLVRRQ
ncbi:glycerate kinase [Neolewinella sp.]|uniref:glycerate kinase family protein n=1 Tax=Neolewinella sp. TaxID=2993543 RepID=UPI003B51F81C